MFVYKNSTYLKNLLVTNEYYGKEYIGAKYPKNRYWIFFKSINFLLSELSVTRCVRFERVNVRFHLYRGYTG